MAHQPVVFITGATGGIGQALAQAYASRGCQLVLAGRQVDRLEGVRASLGLAAGEVLVTELDVTSLESIANAVQAAIDRFGRIDVLVNNAGIAISAPLSKGEGLAQRHMDVNYHGPRRLVEAVLPAMLAAGSGQVVQIASSAGLQGYAYTSAYCASKHALLGYTRAAAAELAKKGIAFHSIAPHFVDSPMTDASVARIQTTTGKGSDEARAALAAMNPDGVLVPAAQVAELAAGQLHSRRSADLWELTGRHSHQVEAGFDLDS
ncbi:MAG: SDR family oxidoreductase [Planctomycetes bacterium]|nr:SDR family oxidoreductase [Planctomycetota bacterium]MCB9909702.1 SDR family oxidoreductase [Planctomycetota bacterium]MCB9911809.1 SDR family oxidoreductase [Planctomycetota bacterium]